MTFDVNNVALRLYRSNTVWVLAWVVFVLIAAAVIALPLAVWRSIVAAHQADTAQHGLLNERYQKGAKMLGSKELPVRLGGNYALARRAREHSGGYHTQIMNLLCAFVRKPPVVEDPDTPRRREDIQAAMAAVCTRSALQIEIEKKGYCPLNFSGTDMQRCEGLTQEQIDEATADSDNPPNLEGVVDAHTGEPLVWRNAPPSG